MPSGNLLSIPAENLYGSVPASTLTSVPAESLVGNVPADSLTSVPATSLFGTILDLHLSPNIARLDANDIVTGLYSFNPPSVFSPFTVNSTGGTVTLGGTVVPTTFTMTAGTLSGGQVGTAGYSTTLSVASGSISSLLRSPQVQCSCSPPDLPG